VLGFDNIEYASLTDVGVRRSHNQDAHIILPAGDPDHWRERGHVFLVADGMGAHAVGELASKLAVDSIPHIYTKYAQEGPLPALRKAFVEANVHIHTRGQQNPEFAGMGTTATALVLRPEGAWVGHVGDSRVYRIRNGAIEQLSFDHSLLWELARRQNVSPDELPGIPPNVIVRSLGPEPLVQVDVEGPHPLQPGDVFVLCSDGLSGPLSDREIGAVASVLPPAEACRLLVDLANLQGGPDNITVMIVRVGDGESKDEVIRARAPRSRWYQMLYPSWPLFSLLVGIGLAAIAVLLIIYQISMGLSVFAFLLAVVAMAVGLAGLLVTHAREERQRREEPDPVEPHLYRQEHCQIEPAILDKLSHAQATLEKRLRDNKWEADWPASEQHRLLAEQHVRAGQMVDACREYCRSLRVMTEALDRQRNKEESFKPLWDRDRNHD
jgi:PPM family protein phosphatase